MECFFYIILENLMTSIDTNAKPHVRNIEYYNVVIIECFKMESKRLRQMETHSKSAQVCIGTFLSGDGQRWLFFFVISEIAYLWLIKQEVCCKWKMEIPSVIFQVVCTVMALCCIRAWWKVCQDVDSEIPQRKGTLILHSSAAINSGWKEKGGERN